jgi:excisionase family DNA binding protein
MNKTRRTRPTRTVRPAETMPAPAPSTNGAPGAGGPAGLPFEPLESIGETAEWSTLPVSWLYAQTAAGTIPHLRIGKYVKFRRSEVLAWLETKRRGPRPQ